MKIMARLLNRNLAGRRARRMAVRSTVVLPAVGAAAIALAGPAFAATEVWAVGFTLPSGGGYHTFAIHHP